ncbi:MAG: enoyl-CoA hydratase/isomerase family protein [Balneolaceae bacterium]|nr:enoyl-CoA hydratase/isomerase family protein [Balneolaceae bacterium]MBO6547001.1 enoyl-CoA hydratase/isomerase family protein [Balneolaceae bacterium]MBO6649361.1 enoyl-CoA hydratase/isomerase family protein [Balneolaceae bacterium]
MDGSVTLSISDKIGIIEFHHPKSNSLPKSLLHKLAETITKAGNDNNIAVIVLKSSGNGAFCAGASFDELMALSNLDEGRAFFSGFGKVIMAMKNCPKFIIAQVHGKTVGGGVGIVAASDYAIACEEASIKLSELSIGIGPFVIAPVVQRKIGVSAISSLSINATEWKSAEWAFNKGLYNDLLDSKGALEEAVQKLAERLSGSNPDAMKHIKEMFWTGMGDLGGVLEQRAEISGRLSLSDFTRNFLRKFKN